MRRFIALILIVAIPACSTARTVPPTPFEVVDEPGLWAVLARPSASPMDGAPRPLSGGSAAAAGAKTGAVGSFGTGAAIAGGTLQAAVGAGAAGGPMGPLLFGAGLVMSGAALAAGVVLAPVAALVGAGVGAGVAHPEPEIAAAERSMTSALDAAKPEGAVRRRVIVLADTSAGRQLHDCGELQIPAPCVDRSPEPIALMLMLTVSEPYFEVRGSIEPDLRLLLSAEASVLRASSGASIYDRAWIYRGKKYDYFELAADDAKLFRAELDMAVDALAAKIVDDILIGGREEVHKTPEQPEGTVWTVIPPG